MTLPSGGFPAFTVRHSAAISQELRFIRQTAFPAANLTRGSGGSEEMQRVRATKGSAALTPPHRPRSLVSLRALRNVISMRPPRQPSLRPTPRATTAEVKAGCLVRHHRALTTLKSFFGPGPVDADVWQTLMIVITVRLQAHAPIASWLQVRVHT